MHDEGSIEDRNVAYGCSGQETAALFMSLEVARRSLTRSSSPVIAICNSEGRVAELRDDTGCFGVFQNGRGQPPPRR